MPLLELQNLKKSYTSPDGSTLPVLDVKSFSVDAGEQIAVVGRSGCGKTTFLHMIAGIITPDIGEITLDAQRVNDLKETARDQLRATTIGYIFQTFNLLQGFSALENIRLGMIFAGNHNADRAQQLLERVGMADRRHYKPNQLSIGQQQRVAVARALANRPKLVLADEPTGNLDPKTARDALTLIREVCTENDAALLLVSHDRSITTQFDKVMDLAEINSAATS